MKGRRASLEARANTADTCRVTGTGAEDLTTPAACNRREQPHHRMDLDRRTVGMIGAAQALGLAVWRVAVGSVAVAETVALHGNLLAVGSFVGAPRPRGGVTRPLMAHAGDTAEQPVLVLEEE